MYAKTNAKPIPSPRSRGATSVPFDDSMAPPRWASCARRLGGANVEVGFDAQGATPVMVTGGVAGGFADDDCITHGATPVTVEGGFTGWLPGTAQGATPVTVKGGVAVGRPNDERFAVGGRLVEGGGIRDRDDCCCPPVLVAMLADGGLQVPIPAFREKSRGAAFASSEDEAIKREVSPVGLP